MGEMSCRTCGCTDFNRRGDQLICDVFWAEHQEEKAALTEKKAQLQKEIAAITKKKEDIAKSNRRTVETLPAGQEMARWDTVVRELQEKQKALSFFQRRQKKELQKEIDAAAEKAAGARNKFLYSKRTMDKRTQDAAIRAAAAISVREVLLDKIDRELEKDRFLSGGGCAMMWTHELRQTLTELEQTAVLDDPFAAGSGKKRR